MYKLVQYIRHHIPFLWNLIEQINIQGFRIRFARGLNSISELCIENSNGNITYSIVKSKDINSLVDFFNRQPKDAFKFFNPHDFDLKTIKKLIANPSFIMLIAKTDNKIIGYAFMRCFANGKAFRGKIVDVEFRGKGIAKTFGKLTTDIAARIGISLFGTISKDNLASMESSKASNEIRIIEELPDNYLLIQYLPKQ